MKRIGTAMKHPVMLLLVVLLSIIVLSSSSQAMALSMPSVTGGYTLKASSPSDNSSTSTIEVQAGEHITVEATADIAYSGITLTSPPITVNTELLLLNGSKEIASATKSDKVEPMLLEDGKSYTMTGSNKIKVPSKTEPGIYTLNCDANAKVSWMFINTEKSQHKSFTVKVIDKNSHIKSSLDQDDMISYWFLFYEFLMRSNEDL